MPKMDGHTFLRRLSSLDLDSAVIVSSADGEMDDVIEVMRHGAIDYVKKPWSQADVLSSIARAIDIRDKRQTSRRALAGALGTTPPPGVPAPPQVFSQILERIQRGEILLPSLPSVIEELRTTVNDRDSPLDRVAKLVERDQALAARVLQLGRSAQHANGKQALDLQATIARLGLKALHALVETVWVNGCFQSRDPRFVPYTKRLAMFGLARAIAARQLAAPAKLDGATAYYSGLFADVGASFLLHVIVEKAGGTAADPEAAIAFVRQHHEPIGAQLLTRWGYRDDVVARAHNHHTASTDLPSKLCTLATVLAGQLTGEDDLTGDMPTLEDADRCAQALNIEPAIRRRCEDAATDELAAVLAVL